MADEITPGSTKDNTNVETVPEQKPTEGQKPEEGAQKEEPTGSQPEKKVEEVKYDLKLPEGSLLSPDTVEKKIADAKARGLTNQQAQDEIKRESELISTYVESQKKLLEEVKEKWLKESTSDKEIGGSELNKNLEMSKRVLQKFDTDGQLIKDLEMTGYGNYPPLVKLLVRIGKSMANDDLVLSNNVVTERRSPAEILYGK